MLRDENMYAQQSQAHMRLIKSEEDIEMSDDEDDNGNRGNLDDTNDSLERATGTDKSVRSIASIADRNITKVSSTRKLND